MIIYSQISFSGKVFKNICFTCLLPQTKLSSFKVLIYKPYPCKKYVRLILLNVHLFYFHNKCIFILKSLLLCKGSSLDVCIVEAC